MIELDDLDTSAIQFSDPFSGQMEDMHCTFDHMANIHNSPHHAMLFRPRLSINDLRDMVENPEFIQFFQYRDGATALNRMRRVNLSQKSTKGARGLIMMQIRDRQIPPARIR